MPNYFFTAKSQQGESYSGTQEAKDQSELARILKAKGYFLISADGGEKKKTASLKFGWDILPFLKKVSLKDKIMLTRNLQVMIGAGISLPKALSTLSAQSKSKKFKRVLAEISEEVIKGKSFSESLTLYPGIFSELFCSMVRVGEESGGLEENLGILTRQMEREDDLRAKIMGALMYPAVIVLAMCGIGIMMLVVVVPKLASTFEELGIELPMTTKVVIALGTFLSEKWYFAALIIVVLFLAFRFLLKIKAGKRVLDFMSLRLPVISPLIKKTNAAAMVRTLSSLVAAGVSLVKALEIVADTLGNFYFKETMVQAVEKVKKGEKLSSALRPYENLYPISVIQMLEVGEETGETTDILDKLGNFFEEEVARVTKNMTAVIEPILMLLIGGVVGFFAISMVQPMYSMLQGIK